MLYFSVVLLGLAGAVWYFVLRQSAQACTPAHRADYVMMDASSQAALQMDPRTLPQEGQ
jgi:hypothetical protein